MKVENYGLSSYKQIEKSEKLTLARVTAVHKERYEIVSDYGMTNAVLKAAIYLNEIRKCEENFPTVGDFVLIEYNPSGDSRIVKTLERKSFFSRRDPNPGRGEQAVAANFDYVFIMASLNEDFNVKRLERYLTLGWQSGATPVVVLTKSDLIEDYTDILRQAEKISMGANVCAVSAVTGAGMDSLKGYLEKGKTIVFLGSSGIGKSSLVNALSGQYLMKTAEIREDDARGRHTTTHRQLIMLENGVMIIDTPGMRELGMWDVTQGLKNAFEDVEEIMGMCRFSDCRHENEPGCAIVLAIKDGRLTEERWKSYIKLKKEAKYTDDRQGYLNDHAKWAKKIAKEQRKSHRKKWEL